VSGLFVVDPLDRGFQRDRVEDDGEVWELLGFLVFHYSLGMASDLEIVFIKW